VNHVERVMTALNIGRPDRVPRGEFQLEEGLIAALLNCRGPVGFTEMIAARELLGMDLVAVMPAAGLKMQGDGSYRDIWGRKMIKNNNLMIVQSPAIPDAGAAASYSLPDPGELDYSFVERWRKETGLFVFAFIDGPFQAISQLFDFTEVLLAVTNRDKGVMELSVKLVEFNLEAARLCRQAGAHGIIIGDDIAYERGTYINPDLWRELFLPQLKSLVEGLRNLDMPVLYHSDGNINAVLPDLAGLPLNGIQCLEPSAGMDIAAIKKNYGNRLCLMGNFDLDLLARGTKEAIAGEVKKLLTVAACNGGYIFSTSSGVLGADLPAENVLALYRAVAKYGD